MHIVTLSMKTFPFSWMRYECARFNSPIWANRIISINAITWHTRIQKLKIFWVTSFMVQQKTHFWFIENNFSISFDCFLCLYWECKKLILMNFSLFHCYFEFHCTRAILKCRAIFFNKVFYWECMKFHSI